MERESFEDADVARLLNQYYVSVKVDREERPDIDSIYMTVCQALTGHGGWPMTIIMTPDGKPFFAGSYFPKYDRMSMSGLLTILKRVSTAWNENRQDVLEAGNKIMDAINAEQEPSSDAEHKGLILAAFEHYKKVFDGIHGGFGHAPKFPSPHILFFLLRYWKLNGDAAALNMTEKTLQSMRRGGIFDHIGYGFSRYSTDRSWLVPHFEKMLYDNALLAIAYLETYQATGNGSYLQTADEIFAYVLRDMTSPEGGFYSAEDADSEGEEGLFYTWTPDEIVQVLGNTDAQRFMVLFDITSKGNFEGRSIPNTIKGSIPGADLPFVEACRQKLFAHREKRIHPFKDDKILVSWNGLMIAALAIGGRVSGNRRLTEAAEKAADFLLTRMVNEKERLLAVYRNGASSLKGYADDYAFLIWGLIELYETTYKPVYLQQAIKLNDEFTDYFWDHENGGFFLYGKDSEQLISRPKEAYDGATPSANSAAAVNLVRLARLTGKFELEERARQIINTFSGSIEGYPAGFSHMLNAALLLEAQGVEVIIAGEAEHDAEKLLDIIRQSFRPFTVSLHYNRQNEALRSLVPYITNYTSVEGKAAAYVCRNFACNQPVTDAVNLSEMLQ